MTTFPRRMILFLLAMALFAGGGSGESEPLGTDARDLSQPGVIKFRDTEVEIPFDEGIEEIVELEGEPQVNRKSFYVDDKLVFTGYDTDGDGSDDLWFHYDEDLYLVLESRDTDGDGEPDRALHYDREENITKDEEL